MTTTEEKIFNILKKSRYFQQVSDPLLQQILVLADLKHYEKGSTVIEQGVPNQKVFIIVQGTVSVWVDDEFIYSLNRGGDIFGEMSVITGEPSSGRIDAQNDVEVITISSALLNNQDSKSQAHLSSFFYQWFSRMLSEKLKRTSQKAKRYEDLNESLQNEIDARILAEKAVQDSFDAIREQQAQMASELEQARDTQAFLLPAKFPEFEGGRFACKYNPMHQIGGDFYDVLRLDENKFGILVADVTGHGISASLISFMVSSVFQHVVFTEPSPAKVLNQTNDRLCEQFPEDRFVTMYYAVYDASTKLLTYSCGGHPPGLVMRPKTKEVLSLENFGMVLGQFPSDIAEYEERTFQCIPGDKILLYTDGITEVAHEKEMLGIDGLIHYLESQLDFSAEDMLNNLYDFGMEYSNFQGFGDDITMLALEIT